MLQRRPVAQHDTPRRGQRDERHSFQIRERARHRLDGEPKIIRSVPGPIGSVMSSPRSSRSAISMRNAARRWSALSSINRARSRVRSSSRLVKTQSCRATSFSAAASAMTVLRLIAIRVGTGDRLGGKRAHLIIDTEEVAGHVEDADLAATVAQRFERAHVAVDHLVEIFGRAVFFVDFGVAGK